MSVNLVSIASLQISFQSFILPKLVYSNVKANAVHTWASESAGFGGGCLLWHTLTRKLQTQAPTLLGHSLPVTTARGEHSSKLLWQVIHVGRHCSNVPGDMICACSDLILPQVSKYLQGQPLILGNIPSPQPRIMSGPASRLNLSTLHQSTFCNSLLVKYTYLLNYWIRRVQLEAAVWELTCGTCVVMFHHVCLPVTLL